MGIFFFSMAFSQILKCDTMRRQLQNYGKRSGSMTHTLKTLVSNIISSQNGEKEKKKKSVNIIKDNEIFSDPGTFV